MVWSAEEGIMAKFCTHCGAELAEGAAFCSACGQGVQPLKRVCAKCGAELTEGAAFCSVCGTQAGPVSGQKNVQQGTIFNGFVNTINNMTGEEGAADIRLGTLFSEAFKKHTAAERDALFVCGTAETTPDERDMIAEWPKPWLYGRVFLSLAIVFVGLYVMIDVFENINAIPGLIFIGAMMVPFSLVIFFWEVNIPRNISIFDCVSMFFIGGVLSLISTLIAYEIVGDLVDASYAGAIFIGLAEEVGKAVIVVYYIRKRNCKYILNGLLIGACVGAGFAVFETAGYAFRYLLIDGMSTMLDVLFLRAILALGGHIVWTAIVGAGLMTVKGEQPFASAMLGNARFLKFFALSVVMHAIWDMPIEFGSSYNLVQWALTAVAVVIVLIQISAGLRQAVRLSNEAKRRSEAVEQAEAAVAAIASAPEGPAAPI